MANRDLIVTMPNTRTMLVWLKDKTAIEVLPKYLAHADGYNFTFDTVNDDGVFAGYSVSFAADEIAKIEPVS